MQLKIKNSILLWILLIWTNLTNFFPKLNSPTAFLIQEKKNQCIVGSHSVTITCQTVMCIVIMLVIDEGHLVFPHVSASCLGKGDTVSFLFPISSASLSPPHPHFIFFPTTLIYLAADNFRPQSFHVTDFSNVYDFGYLSSGIFSSLFFPLNNTCVIYFFCVFPKETTVSDAFCLVFFYHLFM